MRYLIIAVLLIGSMASAEEMTFSDLTEAVENSVDSEEVKEIKQDFIQKTRIAQIEATLGAMDKRMDTFSYGLSFSNTLIESRINDIEEQLGRIVDKMEKLIIEVEK